MNKVIVIDSPDRHGKDTLRRYLVKKSNGKNLVIVRSFISQVVYSRIYNRIIDEEFFIQQALECQKLGHIFVQLAIDIDLVKKRIIDTNEQDVSIENIEYHIKIFNEVVEVFRQRGVKILTIDVTNQNLDEAYKKIEHYYLTNYIQNCKLCSISDFDKNKYDLSKGCGKLKSEIFSYTPKYFIVGMTPSMHRYENLQHPFQVDSKGKNKQFRSLLNELGILEQSVIANLVKCSVPKNVGFKSFASICHEYLKKEIELFQPEYLIALGKDVATELKSYEMQNIRIIELYHPSYCYSHHRITHEEYRSHIITRLNNYL